MSYAESIDQYCAPRHPVIPTDAIDKWPAAMPWTPEYFADRVGDRQVAIDGATYSVEEEFFVYAPDQARAAVAFATYARVAGRDLRARRPPTTDTAPA